MKSLEDFSKSHKDVVFFSDSTALPREDHQTKSIADFVEDYIAPRKVGLIMQPSAGSDFFLDHFKYLITLHKYPKTIIFTINMRSFSPEIDLRPQYQFGRERSATSDNLFIRAFYGPLSVLKLRLNEITEEEFMNSPVFDGEVEVGKVSDHDHNNFPTFSLEGAQKIVTYHYMYSLKKNHRKFLAMQEISRLSKKYDVNILFYITPIDYESGDKFLSGRFSERLRQNTQLLRSVGAEQGVAVEDYSMALPSEDFRYAFPYINEHIGEEGMKMVAKRLAERLKDGSFF